MQAAQENKGKLIAGAVIALLILGVAGYGVFQLLRGKAAAVPFQTFTITQVTNSGNVRYAAISPDGKYVLSIVEDAGKMSLWLRNIPTGSNTQVLPPEAALYQNPAFSPDGNYIYYSKATDAAGNAFNLFRIPVLGGEAAQVVTRRGRGADFLAGWTAHGLRARERSGGGQVADIEREHGRQRREDHLHGADAFSVMGGVVT